MMTEFDQKYLQNYLEHSLQTRHISGQISKYCGTMTQNGVTRENGLTSKIIQSTNKA